MLNGPTMQASQPDSSLRARRGLYSSLRAGVAILVSIGAWSFAACKEEPQPPGMQPPGMQPPEMPDPNLPPADGCEVDADCGFGEIDHEIYRRADCPCLYGCPYVPLSTAAIERRQSQYDMLCDPRTNGNGDGCGID